MGADVFQRRRIELPEVELPSLDWEYPSFAGKPPSSATHWVPIDFAIAKLASILGVSDEKPDASKARRECNNGQK